MSTEKRKNIWSVRYTGTEEQKRISEEIAQRTGISDVCAAVLCNRGYRDANEAEKFLKFDDLKIYSPFLMKDMKKAVSRIKKAVETGEQIIIYGDYDVDGVTSVTMFYLYLDSLGANVKYYIPNRTGEGYGLSCSAIEKMAASGITLIITVDTGITACEETEYAKSLGVDVVITDHHECQDAIPNAYAVVNPKQSDCEYPFKSLAGVGVVFKVISAYEITVSDDPLNESEAVKRIYYKYADLAAIGTIADVMPLIDENRIIVRFGLSMIEKTDRYGLIALMEAASGPSNPNVKPIVAKPDIHKTQQTKRRKVNSNYIGFAIAPRINAAGRISSASKAVELLLADDIETAAILAHELCEINYKRQIEENRIADFAYDKINKTFDFEKEKVIVLSDNDWLQGVVGIVSSKVTEKYGLPSVLISFDGSSRGYESGDDIGKGSGRSIKGFNLVDAMSYAKDTLLKFGGHELAAGLTIRRRDIDAFRKKINEYADMVIDTENLYNEIEVDCEIKASDITMKLAKDITLLEPFGTSNPVPVFMLKNVKVVRAFPIGSGRHIKFVFEKDGKTINGIMFNRAVVNLGIRDGEYVDLLCNIDINEFQNVESLQLLVQDIRLSEEYVSYFENEDRLYDEIYKGSEFSESDGVIPDRDDFVIVYSVLRKEFRLGNDMMHEKELFQKIKAYSEKPLRLVKIKFILEILNELKICTAINVNNTNIYQYDIYFNSDKTNIEKSGILKKLKNQCRRE